MILSRFESNENMYHHEWEHQKNPLPLTHFSVNGHHFPYQLCAQEASIKQTLCRRQPLRARSSSRSQLKKKQSCRTKETLWLRSPSSKMEVCDAASVPLQAYVAEEETTAISFNITLDKIHRKCYLCLILSSILINSTKAKNKTNYF